MEQDFIEILRQLSNILNTPLHLDENQCCAVLVDEKLKIQMELDKSQENIVLSSFILPISPGRFRENVLIEALKANDLYPWQIGVFGYSSYNNQLALFHIAPIKEMNGEKFSDILATFIGKSMEWQNAINSGYSCPLYPETPEKRPFPLK